MTNLSRLIMLMFVFVLGLGTQSSAFAQKGSITGVIVDGDNGETLIGANVRVDGTLLGASTDLDGRYTIPGLDPGMYTLVISYIGYNTITVQDVEVLDGQAAVVDVPLAPEAFGLEEVVVEARAIRNSEAVLLRDRQKAIAVSDAISSEAISRSGGSDAADAMEKVTGASVVGGKYVYVRGLGDRYSSTQLNGADLPSSDPDRKAVQFDLFPSNLLDNIVTLKTFTPDKPGNFSGGLVDIGTKSFPEDFSFQFSVSTSFNSETNFGSDYLTYAGGDTDWLANDDGTRDIPEELADPDIFIPSPVQARFDEELAQRLDVASDAFNNIMSPNPVANETAPLNQSYSISVGNKVLLGGKPLGFVLGGTYSRKASYYENGDIGRYSFVGLDANELAPDLLLDDSKGSTESSLGGLANVTYQFTPNNEVGFNVLYSRSGESSARFQEGTWPKEFGANDTTSAFINRTLEYTERELTSLQLRGKHYLPGLANATVEWNASYGDTRQDEPDLRFFAHTRRTIGQNELLTVQASGFRDPSRLFRFLDETTNSAKIDVSIPFGQGSTQNGKVKFGGTLQTAERDFSERSFSITPPQPYDGDDFAFFSEENMGIISVDTLSGGRLRFNFGNTVVDQSKPQNNYEGTRDINALYAMIELPITPEFKFIGGARLETTELEVMSEDSTQGIGSIDESDILPSANLVYALSDNMNLRAAVTRTLARPTFREIAPFEAFEFINGNFFIGNPELERTLITNVDFRWEWFTRPGEILAVSLFYKKLFDPIERTIIGGTNGQIQFQNVDEAVVLGTEIEIRTRLDFLSPALNAFTFGSNLSFVNSTIDIPESELETRRGVDPDADDTRELQGQSPYIVNIDLSYENNETGTVAGLFYNVFGRRLANVSLGGTPDVFEQPSPQLDFNFSQRLPANWRIKVGVKNILDAAYKETYRFSGQEFNFYKYEPGRTFSLGFSYSL